MNAYTVLTGMVKEDKPDLKSAASETQQRVNLSLLNYWENFVSKARTVGHLCAFDCSAIFLEHTWPPFALLFPI